MTTAAAAAAMTNRGVLGDVAIDRITRVHANADTSLRRGGRPPDFAVAALVVELGRLLASHAVLRAKIKQAQRVLEGMSEAVTWK
jgi:hypothetical protein